VTLVENVTIKTIKILLIVKNVLTIYFVIKR